VRRLAAFLLLASTAVAGAQTLRNGPEWGGKNHQPTQGEVAQREKQAGVRAPPAERQRNGRAVDQLGQKLLHDEAADPPRNPVRPVPP
jgi:hypothetical protein